MSNINIELDKSKQEVEQNFSPKRKSAIYLSNVYEELGSSGKAKKVRECGSFLEYRVSSFGSRLYNANFCKDRLCPLCNWRRSLKTFSKVSKVMDELEKDGYRFIFLTLTIRNCDNNSLKDTIDLLLKAYTKLLRRACVKRAVLGTYRTLELTYSENYFWHPHLHSILAVKEDYFKKDSGLYLTFTKWRDLWKKSCGLDYLPNIFIEAVKKGKLDFSEVDSMHTRSFKSAVKEVSKYICKSDGKKGFLKYKLKEDAERVNALSDAIHRHKLNQFTGVFLEMARKLKLDDLDYDSSLTDQDNSLRDDIKELVVRYRWKNGAYIQEVFDYDKEIEEHSKYKRKEN